MKFVRRNILGQLENAAGKSFTMGEMRPQGSADVFVVAFTAHLFAVYNETCAELIRFLKEASLLNIADISEI